MQIITENLTFSYDGKSALTVKALKGISVKINEGDFFGVVGHTGSGKSTFIQHINGLIKPQKDSGKITVGEFDLTDKKCDFIKLRSKIGMVFQYPEYQLFAETVKEDVAFALLNYYPTMPQAEVQERVKEALELVGLNYDELKDKSPFELSGGQKRRVAIAGVLVSKPEILVLDEPVAGLDPKGKTEFIELLHKINKTFVKTIIIVSHDMNLISENCNRACVFSHGEIVKIGSPKEIFSDTELIENSGLELPVTAYLLKKLEQAGKKIDCGLKIDEFVDAIAKRFRGEK